MTKACYDLAQYQYYHPLELIAVPGRTARCFPVAGGGKASGAMMTAVLPTWWSTPIPGMYWF